MALRWWLALGALAAAATAACRADPPLPAACRAGYVRYGCSTCHGTTGHGVADLRQAGAHLGSDARIEAWIRHPSRLRPGVGMPDFDGVVAERDYPGLVRCVRTLAQPRDP